tara:strand:+ start:596 stop:1600 length:1005 start_codon:yes stop_codon:yes gene_type:complete
MPLAKQQFQERNESLFWEHSDLRAVELLMKSFSIGQMPSLISDMAKDHLKTGGKRFRALMALHAGELLGVPERSARYWAAAVELLHNATLVHDDIQDGDEVRRGEPTVWNKYGVGQAINAGDLMLMVPYQMLSCLDVDGDMLRCLFGSFSHRSIQTVRGQSLEMTLRENLNFDRDTYIQALRGKTGQLLALAIEGPLILKQMSPEETSKLSSAFENLGIAFQIYDDIRDLYSDKGRRQIGNDLREGKISALTIAHLESNPSDHGALLEVLQKPFDEVSKEEVLFWKNRFTASNAPAQCEAWAKSFVDKARFGVGDGCLRDLMNQTISALGLKQS